MPAVKRSTGQTRPVPGGIAIGAATAVIMCLVLSGVTALLIHIGQVKEEIIPVAAIGILFLSTVIGCLIAGKWVKKQLAVVCGSTAAAVTLILMGITIFAFDVDFGNVLGPLIAIVLGSAAASILCAGKGRGKKRHSR